MTWPNGSGLLQMGISEPMRIAEETGLKLDRVHTELGRMADLKQVRRSGPHCWYPIGPCELERCWTGVRPIWRYEVETT
jgi:hypothetical protein